MRVAVAVLMLVVGQTVFAQAGIGFRFSDDTAGLSLAAPLGDAASTQLDWRHHEDGHELASVGLFANGRQGALSGRIGVKGYAFDVEELRGAGLALGGDFGLPMNEFVQIIVSAYIGPGAAAFDDIDGYLEWSISAEMRLFENSALEFGLAEINFDTERRDDIEYEDGPFVRLKLRF